MQIQTLISRSLSWIYMFIVSKFLIFRGFHLNRWMTWFFLKKYFWYHRCHVEKSHQFLVMQNKPPCLEWSVLASSWLLVIVRSFHMLALFVLTFFSYTDTNLWLTLNPPNIKIIWIYIMWTETLQNFSRSLHIWVA